MIDQWRLPEELGGAVVNPTQALTPELASMRRVKVPGTPWTVYVPAVCLVPVVPDEPPVNSVVIVRKAPNRWGLYQRVSAMPVDEGRWSAPGGSGVVHTWRDLHVEWDTVHVVLWWDEVMAEVGAVVPGGRVEMAIEETAEDQPGVARVRLSGGVGNTSFLERDGAFRAAAALLGLAMKELM